MNATGCVTALGDGGEAFVVLLPDDCSHRRPEQLPLTSLPPCPGSRTSPSPPPQPPMATVEAYKTRPRRKDRGAFVILPEPPATVATAAHQPSGGVQSTGQSHQPATSGHSGRVSPFRGYGFRTPENGRSRATSPSPEPLKRQSSEPRITANRRKPADKQRLSVSTKDLSVSGKPPPVPTTASTAKSSPRKKLPPVPSTLRKKVPPKSPLPARSPKVPRKPQLPLRTAVAKPTVTNAARPAAATIRPPPVKSSPRPRKKQSATVTSNNNKMNAPPPKAVGVPSTATPMTTVAATDTMTTTTMTAATMSDKPMMATTSASTITLSAITTPVSTTILTPPATTTATVTVEATTVTVTSVTASTSATAIATTHATNAVTSPVVTGGPVVTAVPPPAAIAANTLATLSVVDRSTTANSLKPPQSAMRYREQPVTTAPMRPSTTVIVMDGSSPAEEATTVRQSASMTMTTTPPLSYELQEIIVEPELDNQSGRTNRVSDTLPSSNGHKTVAWARPSEKIIVAADLPRSAEVTVAKDPVYKRFARKLCGGNGDGSSSRRRSTVGKRPPTSTTAAAAASAVATDSRSKKFWAAVWKRRPRLCGKCCGQKRKRRPATAAAMVAAKSAASADVRPRRWFSCCVCCGKRKKKAKSDSIGALGIAPPTMPPPTTDTFCGKLKRRLCCCCCCFNCSAVTKFVRRLCCCSFCCCSRSDVPKKSVDGRSLFKCTGCCTNIPKLDAVFVDHSSVMKGAIPVLPVTLAWLCLVFNVIIPGAGTFSSGMLCLCVGKPRFTVNDNFQSRLGAFCVNFIVAAAQLFTVLFCLVGWGWSIWWGLIMLKIAKKYQLKVKIIDHPVEAPVATDQNHQV